MRRASPRTSGEGAVRSGAWRFWSALALAVTASGCDIVEGFQNAGDTIFPEQSTHLSSPSLRLVAGGYRYIDIAAGQRLHLLARSAAGGDSLFAMRYADPHPCEISGVVRYASTRDPNRDEPILAYFQEDARQGVLHFADTACRSIDFSVSDARLPLIGDTPTSIIIWAGTELIAVDPRAGTRTTLTQNVDDVIVRAFANRSLVRTAGRLEAYGLDWKSQGTFGDGVTALWRTSKATLYLDNTGLRRLSAGNDDSTVTDALIQPDVCRMNMQDGTWATFYSPCASEKRVAFNEATGKLFDLTTSADPRYLRLIPARGSPGRDPLVDPFWFLFLRAVDAATGRGELVLKTPKGEERVLGQNASLERTELLESPEETHGYAFVDLAGLVGKYIYWNDKGETRELAQNAFLRSRRLIVDFDGAIGNAAVVSGDRLAVVAERVPYQAFEFQDVNRQWTVVFHDWSGDTGKLSAFPGTFDTLARTPLTAPFQSPTLEPIAPSVAVYRTAPLGEVLPGAVFLADYDAETNTGRLEYRNTELRFSATIDRGVSDYLITRDEVIYSVPFGDHAGIWLTAGK